MGNLRKKLGKSFDTYFLTYRQLKVKLSTLVAQGKWTQHSKSESVNLFIEIVQAPTQPIKPNAVTKPKKVVDAIKDYKSMRGRQR